MLTLTKHFTLHFAHALTNYNGPCQHLHGHTYHLAVTVCASDISQEASEDYIMDFHNLKQFVEDAVVNKFDHSVVLSTHNPLAKTLGGEANAVIMEKEPTTENLLRHFAQLIACRLPQNVKLRSVKLGESPTSEAELILD
jgi:6-pyruvoyltetrahydropterin/6-carboxytetrahydropterin synthase